MLVKDIIKMRYIYDGYLPNYPYHMISDKEIISGFMNSDGAGFFVDNYPCMINEAEYLKAYNQLKLSIMYYVLLNVHEGILSNLSAEAADNIISTPNWVYSYRMGSVISVSSDKYDIHDLEVSLGTSNFSDTFTDACSAACLRVSKQWLGNNVIDFQYGNTIDVPDIFIGKMSEWLAIPIESTIDGQPIYLDENQHPIEVSTLWDLCVGVNGTKVYIRPPAMFGEPHVIKALRLQQIAL
jgi:hypothetical protein